MTERDKILQRIRLALKNPAPMPGAHGSATGLRAARTAAESARDWLPQVGPSPGDWMTLFTKHCSDLKTEIVVAADAAAAQEQLRRLALAEQWQRVATHGAGEAAEAAGALGLPVLSTDGGYDAKELEACDAGISGCDALIAQTGSILLTARSGGGRALSVLPPHHVVVARREQLVPDLPAAFAWLHHCYGPADWPSMMTLITGPSRTGDIERILVLGAHGPKKLTVLVY
jgi:L-lactate dehydrogenase complex protein LldG